MVSRRFAEQTAQVRPFAPGLRCADRQAVLRAGRRSGPVSVVISAGTPVALPAVMDRDDGTNGNRLPGGRGTAARYAAGDDRAFGEVYAAVRAAPHTSRFLSRRLRDKTRLPDLVQETLLRVHRFRSSFVPGAAVLPWVLTIARHELISAYRSSAREEQADTDRLDRHAGPATMESPPTGEEMVLAKETAARLDRAFARVSEPQRAALRLVTGEGLSLAQAAAALGTTTTGVKLRTHRAFRVLRAELTNELAAA